MYKVIIAREGKIMREAVPITISEVIEYLDLYQLYCDVIVIPLNEVTA